MVTPQWVTNDFFEKALKSYFKNDIKIIKHTSIAAVPAGDNYASDLLRTSITYEIGQCGQQETMSVITKYSPEHRQQMQQLLINLDCFEKEAKTFITTLPAIYELLGKYWTLSAKCIYYENKPHTVLLLEDLSPLGFKMHERQQGLDLEHCLLTVKKLARLHAGSVVLLDKNPSLICSYQEGLFSKPENVSDWLTIGFNSLIEASTTWSDFEKYRNKLLAIKSKAANRAAAASKRKLGGFNVLNHGDTWINNILFSYTNNEKVKDCRFVDYQLTVYTSPAIDLHYFWATSPSIEARREHLDTVLDYYYAELLSTLAKLQYSLERVPTRTQFREDWNSRVFYGLAAAMTVLPLVKASSREDASLEELMGGEGTNNFRHHIYSNERYRKHMEYLLPFFDNFGALDYY